jgi:predicted nucleic acid-binding Zn ribbon protein
MQISFNIWDKISKNEKLKKDIFMFFFLASCIIVLKVIYYYLIFYIVGKSI